MTTLIALLVRTVRLHAAWLPAVALAVAMAAVACAGEFAIRTMRFRPGSGLAVPLGLAMTPAIFATSLVAWHGGGGFGPSAIN